VHHLVNKYNSDNFKKASHIFPEDSLMDYLLSYLKIFNLYQFRKSCKCGEWILFWVWA